MIYDILSFFLCLFILIGLFVFRTEIQFINSYLIQALFLALGISTLFGVCLFSLLISLRLKS